MVRNVLASFTAHPCAVYSCLIVAPRCKVRVKQTVLADNSILAISMFNPTSIPLQKVNLKETPADAHKILCQILYISWTKFIASSLADFRSLDIKTNFKQKRENELLVPTNTPICIVVFMSKLKFTVENHLPILTGELSIVRSCHPLQVKLTCVKYLTRLAQADVFLYLPGLE